MNEQLTNNLWVKACEYGILGVMLLACVVALIWFVRKVTAEGSKDKEKLISILETTVQNNTKATNNLADSLRQLPCTRGSFSFKNGE